MSARGIFRIRHGDGWLAKGLAWLFRLPPAGESVETRLTVRPQSNGEQWVRRFSGHTLITDQYKHGGNQLGERHGLIELCFRLSADTGALVYEQVAAAVRWGPIDIPLPRWLSPMVWAREEPGDKPNSIRVEVKVSYPLAGDLLSYEGTIAIEGGLK